MKTINGPIIPEKGYIFAYSFNKDILFDSYEQKADNIILGNGKMFQKQDYYEYHLFDERQEYRFVTRNGKIRELYLTAEEEENPDLVVYREEQFLKDEYCTNGQQRKLIVMNRFYYNENDSLYLKEYRLAGVTI